MHYKTDLLTDAQMSDFITKVGDVLVLDVPNGTGGFTRTQCLVTDLEISDAGKHPKTGEHLTRVTIQLE